MSWTPEQVTALAPDEASARAGRGLAARSRWADLGQDAGALWGLCQGSGKHPYQTQVDLSEPAFKCSCPSRKFPCKHALGLMLVWAGDPDALTPAQRPQWVTEWLDSRAQRAERVPRRSGEEVADPAARERRAAQREERVVAGIAELRRWLEDLVRGGLGSVQQRSYGFWDEVAARMVDAQAGGLATRVRRMAGVPGTGDGWPERLLEQAALLYALLEAYGRQEALSAELAAEVRALVGWTTSQEEVLAGPTIRDQWAVLGQVTTDDERLRVRRTWLWGLTNGRSALVLSFAAPGQVLDTSLVVGTILDADLAFFAAAHPQRALVATRHGAPAAVRELPGHASVEDALAARAGALAASPWLDRHGVALSAVIPAPAEYGWTLVDGAGAELPLARGFAAPHALAALSGGSPIGVFGELELGAVRPLSAFADGRLVAL